MKLDGPVTGRGTKRLIIMVAAAKAWKGNATNSMNVNSDLVNVFTETILTHGIRRLAQPLLEPALHGLRPQTA